MMFQYEFLMFGILWNGMAKRERVRLGTVFTDSRCEKCNEIDGFKQ